MQPEVDYNQNKFAFEISLAVLSFSPDRKAWSELVIHSVSYYNSVFRHDFAILLLLLYNAYISKAHNL